MQLQFGDCCVRWQETTVVAAAVSGGNRQWSNGWMWWAGIARKVAEMLVGCNNGSGGHCSCCCRWKLVWRWCVHVRRIWYWCSCSREWHFNDMGSCLWQRGCAVRTRTGSDGSIVGFHGISACTWMVTAIYNWRRMTRRVAAVIEFQLSTKGSICEDEQDWDEFRDLIRWVYTELWAKLQERLVVAAAGGMVWNEYVSVKRCREGLNLAKPGEARTR